MAKPTPRYDWYLKDWLRASNKKQADLEKDLGWNKSKASLLARGIQSYSREDINEISEYLNVRPWELLMHPSEANALRMWRAEMIRIAHDSSLVLSEEPPGEAQKKVSAA